MQETSLLNGKKEELLVIFRDLKKVHGRRWVSLLKKQNSWHGTRKAMYAWQNASRGIVGIETLRLIISDMEAIVKKEDYKKTILRQGLKQKSLQNV